MILSASKAMIRYLKHMFTSKQGWMTHLLYLGIHQVEVARLVLIQLHGALARHSLAVIYAVQHLLMRR